MSIINQPCRVTYCNRSLIVIPRRRRVMGGWHEMVNGRRVYHVNCRFECEWRSSWTDWHGITHLTTCCELFAEWELERVGSMDYEMGEVA